ncbi:MAG TPA: malto-oligosyltrehalose trehalohydrolase [Streptosporangiaceae bacterium]|nr:malto-oligosyltrehalose trehalohydrolase [Streptosporangiaceae bacterium]
MTEFRVWAPRPHQVEVLVRGGRLPMSPAGDGWWSCREDAAGPGSCYAYSLNGGPERPDPRAPFQPFGINGPSKLIDHESFGWSDAGWRGVPLPGSVIYECHIGTFSAEGTFAGAIRHLDHLVGLGVDLVEIMPVAEFSGMRGWGYDGVHLFAPHHAYGGPDGLKRLVDAAHARGLGVIIDVVYNHLGPAGNYLPEYGPYFTSRQATWWGEAVNFDGEDSGEVRRFVIDNALMWLRDYHADGLRIDAVHAIYDRSATHIMAELAAEVRALAAHLRRNLILIAESDQNDPRLVTGQAQGGYGLDASWADEWHHGLHAVLTGERDGYYSDFGSLRVLAKALRQAWVHDGSYSSYRRRVHGRSPAGLSGSQFVVCTQNHDQVGNRAAGERLSGLVSLGRLKVAAVLLLTSPFVPMLFQGEEWGAASPFPYFTDHRDPELAKAVREGRKAEFAAFGWDPGDVPDPQDAATFEQAKLDWAEARAEGHAELLAWYRLVIGLRRRYQALSDPRFERVETECDDEAGWLTVRRGPLLVAVNLGAAVWTCAAGAGASLLAGSDPGVILGARGLELPPDTAGIVAGTVAGTVLSKHTPDGDQAPAG